MASNWKNSSKLAEGEVGIDTTLGTVKIGDGSTGWDQLESTVSKDLLGPSVKWKTLATKVGTKTITTTVDSNTGSITMTANSINYVIPAKMRAYRCETDSSLTDKLIYPPGYYVAVGHDDILNTGDVFAVHFVKGATKIRKITVQRTETFDVKLDGSNVTDYATNIQAGDIVVFGYDGTNCAILAIGRETSTYELNNQVYVGGTAVATGSFLPITGGTLNGNLYVGHADSNSQFTVNGSSSVMRNSNVYGNLTVAGTINNGSDIRRKDVVKEDYLPTLSQVAQAPAIQFSWKDMEDKSLHVGTTAQYWKEVLPEIVKEDENGILFMEYATAGLMSAIAVARAVEQYESRIKALEDKIAAMEGSDSSGETT